MGVALIKEIFYFSSVENFHYYLNAWSPIHGQDLTSSPSCRIKDTLFLFINEESAFSELKTKKRSKLEYFKQRTVVIFQYFTTHIQCIHIHTFLFSSKEVPWSIVWDDGGETRLESLGTGEQLKWTITLISRIKITLKGSVNMVNKIVSKPRNIIFLALAFQR